MAFGLYSIYIGLYYCYIILIWFFWYYIVPLNFKTMSEKEFLEKYGNEKVYFTGMYKFRAMYENKELGIYCSGVVEYRDGISYEETINSVFDLEYFQYGVKS